MDEFNLKNERGFTLIEAIVVLLILGILMAVAIPKYMSLIDDSRKMSAKVAVADIKGRLSQAQAKYMLTYGGRAPNGATLYIYATNTAQFGANLTDVGTDFNIYFSSTVAPLTITVDRVQNQILANSIVDYFNAAGD